MLFRSEPFDLDAIMQMVAAETAKREPKHESKPTPTASVPSFNLDDVQRLLRDGGYETPKSESSAPPKQTAPGTAKAQSAPNEAAETEETNEGTAPGPEEPQTLDATIARLEEMAKQAGGGIKRAKTNFGKTVVKED